MVREHSGPWRDGSILETEVFRINTHAVPSIWTGPDQDGSKSSPQFCKNKRSFRFIKSVNQADAAQSGLSFNAVTG